MSDVCSSDLYSTFARGMAIQGYAPSCFVEILDNLWWRLDKALAREDLYPSTITVAMEGIRAGVTTMIDHHASPHCVPRCLDEVERAFLDAGMRGILCYEVSDRDGKEISDQGIAENERFIQKANASRESLVKGTFGLHASFTVEEETLQKSVDVAKKLGVGLHLHVAEDHADQTLTLSKTHKRVVKRLYDAGGLGPKTIAAHTVWIDEEEKRLLAETGTWAVHNPRSNMNNAVGAMDLLGIMGHGVKVALGSDGMAASLWPEIQTAALIHKHEKRNPRVVWMEILEMIKNNRELASLFFERPIGRLVPHAYADVVIYDYYPPTPMDSDNFLGHLLFGFAHVKAETVVIDGKVVLENNRFTYLDEQKITAKSRAQAGSFWKRFNSKEK